MLYEDNIDQSLKYINDVLSLCIKKSGIKLKDNSTECIANVQINIASKEYMRKVKQFYFFSFLTPKDAGNYLLTYIIDALADLVNYTIANNGTQKVFSFFSTDSKRLSEEEASSLVLSNTTHTIINEFEQIFKFSFEDIDKLSLTKHEGEKARGNLLFLSTDGVNIDELKHKCVWTVTNALPCFSGEYIRYIRKLLAGSEDGALLFVFSKKKPIPYFFGVVEKDALIEFPFRIEIIDTLKWNIIAFNNPILMSTFDGIRACADNKLSTLEDALKKEFKKESISEDFMKLLINIKKQKHGSSVVIVDLSCQYKHKNILVKRLDNLVKHDKAIQINKSKFNITDNSITNAAKMDGTIIVDISEGKIIYLATIVDGLSKIKGDSSRGARFNSIKNFTYDIAMENIPIVSAVFSEDGGEDIFQGSNLKSII